LERVQERSERGFNRDLGEASGTGCETRWCTLSEVKGGRKGGKSKKVKRRSNLWARLSKEPSKGKKPDAPRGSERWAEVEKDKSLGEAGESENESGGEEGGGKKSVGNLMPQETGQT